MAIVRGAGKLLALVLVVLGGVPAATASAQSPGSITQLPGDTGCFTETGSDGGSGTCAVGRLVHEQAALAMTPDARFVYSAASGSSHGGNTDVHGIAVFRRDTASGALTQLAGAEGCVSNDGTDGRGGECGQVDTVNGTDMLSAKALAISPDGKHLYLAGEQGIIGFTINPATGALTQDAGCVTAAAVNSCSVAVGVDDATSVQVSTDGKTVYVAGNTGSNVGEPDAIAVLSRDPATGRLTQLALPAGCIADSPGSDAAGCRQATALFEPLDIVISPDAKHVYVSVSEGIDTNQAPKEYGAVSAFERDPSDGSLTQIDCNGEHAAPPPNGTGCASDGFALGDAMGIDVSHDGKNIYVAAQGPFSPDTPGTVVVFSRDGATGKLTQIQCLSGDGSDGYSVAGVCDAVPNLIEPSGVAVSREGSVVYVASSDGSGPTMFSRDAATGKLTPLPGADGCVRDDGAEPCATGRAPWSNSVLLTPTCENVYFGGHSDSTDDSSISVFSRTPDCRPTSTASVAACTTSGDVVVSVTDTAGWTGPKVVHFRIDGGAQQTAATGGGATGTATINVPEGKHALEYWGEDEAHALERTVRTASVVVDRTNPTVAITSDQRKRSYANGARASVTTTASDANSGLKTDPSGKTRISTDKAGKRTITRRATDQCGNVAIARFTYKVGPKSMRLSVTPGAVFAGDRVMLSFAAYSAGKGGKGARSAVRGATIRFAGHRLRTDSRGRAHITLRLARVGAYSARATKRGYTSARASVRARAGSGVLPQFTG